MRPLTLKPEPVAETAEIVTLAVPEFVKVTGTDPLLPTKRLPKLMLEGFAVKEPCVPVPVNATLGSDDALVTLILPESLPVAVGAKTAEKVVLWPALRVSGVVMPLTLKPVPVALTCVTVALLLPVLVNVMVWFALLPTVTFPNATLPGFTVKVAFETTPLPASVSVCGEFGAPSVNTMLPVALPAAVGENCTLNERFCPAWIVAGSEIPLIPKPAPDTVARFTTRLELPVFVRVTLCDVLWPTVTFPKLSEGGDMESPACVPVPVKDMARGEFEASLVIVSVADPAPAVCGAY